MLDRFSELFKDSYTLQDDSLVISYTLDSEIWYGLKIGNNFDDVSESLLKCNEDVKELYTKINRLSRLRGTLVGRYFGLDQKKIDYLGVIVMIDLQMFMINKAVAKLNNELHKELKVNVLTSKLFEENEEQDDG